MQRRRGPQRDDEYAKPLGLKFIDYIVKVTASCNGRDVLDADWGPSVSKNPYLAFRFKGAAKGDKLKVTWTDTANDMRSDEVAIG